MTEESRTLDQQRRFYESRPHGHLRPQEDDRYSQKLVAELVRAAGIQPHHRVCEIGASFGRFTIPLLAHCRSIVAVDISERALADLDAARDAAGIEASRCTLHAGDAAELTPDAIGGPVDFVVGFFILHHLEDVPTAIRAAAGLVVPGGGAAFLEPNRRNPLFLAQVLACEDMRWSEEKGMFTLSARGVEEALGAAGLEVSPTIRFGFFPPQLVNRFAWARRLEAGIERSGLLTPVLPFLLMTARAPGASERAS